MARISRSEAGGESLWAGVSRWDLAEAVMLANRHGWHPLGTLPPGEDDERGVPDWDPRVVGPWPFSYPEERGGAALEARDVRNFAAALRRGLAAGGPFEPGTEAGLRRLLAWCLLPGTSPRHWVWCD